MKSTENMYLADCLSMFYLDHQHAIVNMKLIVPQESTFAASLRCRGLDNQIDNYQKTLSVVCRFMNKLNGNRVITSWGAATTCLQLPDHYKSHDFVAFHGYDCMNALQATS